MHGDSTQLDGLLAGRPRGQGCSPGLVPARVGACPKPQPRTRSLMVASSMPKRRSGLSDPKRSMASACGMRCRGRLIWTPTAWHNPASEAALQRHCSPCLQCRSQTPAHVQLHPGMLVSTKACPGLDGLQQGPACWKTAAISCSARPMMPSASVKASSMSSCVNCAGQLPQRTVRPWARLHCMCARWGCAGWSGPDHLHALS